MNRYSNRREPARKPQHSGVKDQGVIDTTGLQVKHGPAPKAETVRDPVFSAARPGTNPLTGRAW